MKKDLLKSISEKLKTDKKTRAAAIASVIGVVMVIVAAVTIPVAMHNRVKVETDAESAAITAEAETIESVSVTATEPETVSASEVTTEPTTVGTTEKAANNNAGVGKNTPADTNKGGGSNKSGSSDSSAQKPNGGSSSGGQSQQKPPEQNETPIQSNENQWTQAEVNSLVAEIKAYAQSKGFTINPSLTTQGTSWSNPVHTGINKVKTKADLKYDIDFVYNLVVQQVGHFPEGAELNVIAKPYAENEWEIYVVY